MNETVTYYVTVDQNDYVQSASSQADSSKRKVDIPLESLTDFNLHMNLYQVDVNGKINYPDLKAATLSDEITQLKATADEQAQTVSTLITQNQNLQKLLVGLQTTFTAQITKLSEQTK